MINCFTKRAFEMNFFCNLLKFVLKKLFFSYIKLKDQQQLYSENFYIRFYLCALINK